MEISRNMAVASRLTRPPRRHKCAGSYRAQMNPSSGAADNITPGNSHSRTAPDRFHQDMDRVPFSRCVNPQMLNEETTISILESVGPSLLPDDSQIAFSTL